MSPSPGHAALPRGRSAAKAALQLQQVLRRHWLLIALVLFSFAWDLHAILLDRRFRGTDNFTTFTADAYLMIYNRGFFSWWRHGLDISKGPLAILLSLPLLIFFRRLPLATRLLSCIVHGVVTCQCYFLAGKVGQERRAGLWAALIFSTTPLVFGLFRLTHYDVLLTVFTLGTIQLIAAYSPDKSRHAVGLGVISGAGLLTKLSFPQFVLWPYLCLLFRWWRHGRFWRQALHIIIIAASCLFIWFIFYIEPFLEVFFGARWAGAISLGEKLSAYSLLPDIGLLLIGTLLSLWLLCLLRQVSLFSLALLFSSIPMLGSLFWLVDWSRYLLPITPLLAVTIGLGLSAAQGLLPPQLRLATGALLAAVILGRFVFLNVHGLEPRPIDETRERYSGMITPDRRQYGAYSEVFRAFPGKPPRVLTIYDTWAAHAEVSHHLPFWAYRNEGFQPIELEVARDLLTERQTVYVLLVRNKTEVEAPTEQICSIKWNHPSCTKKVITIVDFIESTTANYQWLINHPRRRRLAAARDPDGIEFSAWVLW